MPRKNDCSLVEDRAIALWWSMLNLIVVLQSVCFNVISGLVSESNLFEL